MKKTWSSAKIIGVFESRKFVLMNFKGLDTASTSPEAEANYLRIMQDWLKWFQEQYPNYTLRLESKVTYTPEGETK